MNDYYYYLVIELIVALNIASIRRTEGNVEWKNPEFSGIDVPIDAIKVYKDIWNKIKE